MNPVRRILFLILIAFLVMPSVGEADRGIKRDKYGIMRHALVIGNGAYAKGELRNPPNDAEDMSRTLKSLGFDVVKLVNANQQEMETAIREFGSRLKRGGVGLFYYAGHGIQVNGLNYLIPIGANIDKEADVKYDAVNAGRVLDEMYTAENGLNIVLLDACRDSSFVRSWQRSNQRGLAQMDSPVGTFIGYATAPGKTAADGYGRNGIFTKHFLRHMVVPNTTIEKVMKRVRIDVAAETGQKQIPWEYSSLMGDFYFVYTPNRAAKGRLYVDTEPADARVRVMNIKPVYYRGMELEPGNYPIEVSMDGYETEKRWVTVSSGVHQKVDIVLRRKRVPTPGIIDRDGRFIAYSDGTVLDTHTHLMWAFRDNGADITWDSALAYCQSYTRGGYRDWRMPTLEELRNLYDPTAVNRHQKTGGCSGAVHLTDRLQAICYCFWSSEARDTDAVSFYFDLGIARWDPKQTGQDIRVLPVRDYR